MAALSLPWRRRGRAPVLAGLRAKLAEQDSQAWENAKAEIQSIRDGRHPVQLFLNDKLKAAEAELAALRERERWIPVEEKLPELAGEYQVYQPGWDAGETADWMGQSAWWSVRTYGVNSETRELHNVTHWKALSAAPEAKS
jgi:hypothetical protein